MRTLLAATTVALVTGSATADMTGIDFRSYSVTAADFGGAEVTVNVIDLYIVSNDANDVLLNVYNLDYDFGTTNFFQSATSTGWLAQNAGGIFDNDALQVADSFVTIGGFGADGRQTPGAGAGTGLDPNLGGNTAAAPGALAGWYNGSPPSLNGAVMDYDAISSAVLIGRFTSTDAMALGLTSLEVTWNQGLGTGGQQAEFIFPTPGAMALFGVAGLATRRRRG